MTDPLADADDRALHALGRRARERVEARARAWEAVAHGERGEDEVAAEQLAAGDAPEAVARARALFRPHDEAEHATLLQALLDQRAAAHEPVPAEPAANDSGRAWLWVGLAVAAAIVLGWWLVPDRSGPSIEPHPPVVALGPLPAYDLSTDGGLTAMRSQPAEPTAMHRYRAGSPFEWVVRPRVAATGEVGARLFVFGPGKSEVLAAAGLVEVSPAGAVRVAGTIDALGLARGEWTIAIAVGRPAALPSDPAAVRDAEAGEEWIVRRVWLVLEQ